jgi:hypothetical protein
MSMAVLISGGRAVARRLPDLHRLLHRAEPGLRAVAEVGRFRLRSSAPLLWILLAPDIGCSPRGMQLLRCLSQVRIALAAAAC